MGYAGYAPAKLPPPKPTAVQAALWKVTDPAALEMIAKLLRNAVVNPSDAKFKQIKLSNPKIQSVFGKENGALDALIVLGWERSREDEDKVIIPEGRAFSMAEVRLVQDAGVRLTKELQTQKRSANAKSMTNADQSRIRQQMEADRLERLSRQTKDS